MHLNEVEEVLEMAAVRGITNETMTSYMWSVLRENATMLFGLHGLSSVHLRDIVAEVKKTYPDMTAARLLEFLQKGEGDLRKFCVVASACSSFPKFLFVDDTMQTTLDSALDELMDTSEKDGGLAKFLKGCPDCGESFEVIPHATFCPGCGLKLKRE